MHRSDKERVVSQLAERLRSTETLMVADYRGLTMPQIEELRTRLLEAGARFTVVKNTLTRRAAEEAGTKEVLELIDGPTAIAFLESDGDPVAVAKVLSETARAHNVLVIRGGLLEGSLVGALDARIKQLQESQPEPEPEAEPEPEPEPQAEAPAEESSEASEEQSEEPSAEAEPASAESEEEEASGDED